MIKYNKHRKCSNLILLHNIRVTAFSKMHTFFNYNAGGIFFIVNKCHLKKDQNQQLIKLTHIACVAKV